MNLNIWQLEPAMISGLVAAVIVLLVAFNVPISEDQKSAILGFTAAALMILQGLITRSQVTPVAKVVEQVP